MGTVGCRLPVMSGDAKEAKSEAEQVTTTGKLVTMQISRPTSQSFRSRWATFQNFSWRTQAVPILTRAMSCSEVASMAHTPSSLPLPQQMPDVNTDYRPSVALLSLTSGLSSPS